MNLLLAEDEKRMVELLRKGLEEEGHTVICATDGVEALELSRTYKFDLIILDVMMPRLDGYEVARKLRAEKIPYPILMLTAKDSVQDIVHGLDLGADRLQGDLSGSRHVFDGCAAAKAQRNFRFRPGQAVEFAHQARWRQQCAVQLAQDHHRGVGNDAATVARVRKKLTYRRRHESRQRSILRRFITGGAQP